jgi:hypothetical protein
VVKSFRQERQKQIQLLGGLGRWPRSARHALGLKNDSSRLRQNVNKKKDLSILFSFLPSVVPSDSSHCG